MTASIEGRKAIVTGAAQGLGLAYALALARAGAHVAVCDSDASVEDLASHLAGCRGSFWATVADVSSPDDVRRFVDGAAERLGGIDIVVNNAAVCLPTNPVSGSWDKAVDDCDRTLGTNIRGAYLVGRAAIPYLVRQGGDIVNVTTDHIHTCGWPEVLDHADAPACPWASTPRPPGGGTAFDLYDASKWALNGLTHAWAQALRPRGVRVNSFGMGATDTPMYRRFLGDRPPAPGLMAAGDVAAVLLDLLAEGPQGRTGDSIQLWVGHPCILPPVAALPAVVASQ
ncbi:SDR family oxidoreductase [Frankia sp. Cr1]|uniref:SDR family NAD(P)-dependent oxidoreductase n=1 Tax=Frankia sp. Cr1 TaxID=3073931 RepID=UPI002AD35E6A|nr:SDR family oxidoreductase [Frankia sp. Cr1]